MATRPSWVSLTVQQQAELEQCLPDAGWRILSPAELPSVFPQSIRAKIESAVLIATPTSTGGTYLAVSANRIDAKARAVDIDPLGLIVHSTGASTSAVFLHHGDWPERTQTPPQSFWDDLSRSGIGNYYCSNPPRGLQAGTLDQLPAGHHGAFDALVKEIRSVVDSTK